MPKVNALVTSDPRILARAQTAMIIGLANVPLVSNKLTGLVKFCNPS